MLEETPWVRQAQAESQARRNVGILFEDNRLNDETARALQKLAEGQYQNGAWPWFPGGPPNDYITLYITTGFGRLRHLGVKVDMQPAFKSLARLDGWIDEIYREILQRRPQGRESPQPDDRALSLWPQLLPGRPADRRAGQGGGRLLPRPGPQVLAVAGRPPVAGPSGRGPEAFWRQAGRPGHHALDQGAERQRRGAGHVLARHRAFVLVVSRPDRDPGHDDRGLRRGDGRPEGGRGLQGLALEAEADAGLEDDQGHGRRRLCPAAPRQQRAGLRRTGRGQPRRQARSSPRRSRPAPASTSRSSSAARSSRRWATSP